MLLFFTEGDGGGARYGLYYYQNGVQVGSAGTPVKGNYPTDAQTTLTIGKPNFGDKYFGRFLMDTFVIYYQVVSQSQILSSYGGGNFMFISVDSGEFLNHLRSRINGDHRFVSS